MIVMKFGGSSLASADRIRHVGRIVESHLHKSPLVVLSAMGKTTDDLMEAGRKALGGKSTMRKFRIGTLRRCRSCSWWMR